MASCDDGERCRAGASRRIETRNRCREILSPHDESVELGIGDPRNEVGKDEDDNLAVNVPTWRRLAEK